MLAFLYGVFIEPIKLLLEVIFYAIFRRTSNAGMSIIAVSLVVNFLILPLYKKSDAMQEEENKKQKEMQPWVSHIKKTFKGDERFMMLSAYYKEQNYQPYYALRGSVSLLLQIPFFIAAYSYLSHLSILQGFAFGVLKNLAKEDALIHMGNMTLNLLPILMTCINLISGYIYTRSAPIKEKVQLVVMALIFLGLLYNCPSGLVLYWTLNNAFSLCKNLFMKVIPFPQKIFSGRKDNQENTAAGTTRTFCISSLLIVLLSGVLIPLSVVSASPMEFVNVNNYINPIQYIVYTLSVSLGVFFVWNSVIYIFSKNMFRVIWSRFITALSGMFILNYFVFNDSFGNISPKLKFDLIPEFSSKQIYINLIADLVIMGIIFWGFKHIRKIVNSLIAILIICTAILSGKDCIKMNREINDAIDVRSAKEAMIHNDPILTLSKNGTNVVVIMLDRAIGAYIPFIMDEKPELKEVYSGFTFYPNTVSFGPYTNYATPSLFGGYEYTPKRINERETESLASKQNEALRVLPAIFGNNDYHVVVCDPPYAGYTWYPDLSIYDGMKNTKAYHCEDGEYLHLLSREEQDSVHPELLKRNFFVYSIYKIVPTCLQRTVYDEGDYYSTTFSSMNPVFLDHFSFLKSMSKFTSISNGKGNNCILIQNSSTHEPNILEKPAYLPTTEAYYKGAEPSRTLGSVSMKLENEEQQAHYDSNMAALIQIGKWIQYLKENDVYDNTRIMIVSDHGRDLHQFDNMLFDDIDVEYVNPLFMIKDFNSSGELIQDDTFMTNADMPTLATKDIIDNPVNPFSKKPINNEEKEAKEQIITLSDNYDIEDNNGNVFDTENSDWFSVHDDIFNPDDWVNLGPDNAAGKSDEEAER